ncbi:hypothetical protein H696_03898 [Fonticula alba]|uniref:Ribosomal RNA-processing protein 43 n=1 Tax=Fonticula alba TaxID=691883 RepID=A0A058Z5D9_FONAL|nr:hypothetical protein H696_03898 [Fonticula alba]KCV69469.1 hypothetical protein H696_03898 [Fonticula alba]|eukprot:XP_009496034.1 hypothetical protein H696_03898 [Fonticula alba]
MSLSYNEDVTPELLRVIHPQDYISALALHNVRGDGRQFDAMRPLELALGTVSSAEGSATARIGNTTVVAGAKVEIGAPLASAPGHGFVIPNVIITGGSSSEAGRLAPSGLPSDQAQVLSKRLADYLLQSGCVDMSQLCVHEGQCVMVVYLDIVCVAYDGGLLDAALAAAVGALRDLALPNITFDTSTGTASLQAAPAGAQPRRLTLRSVPMSLSFGMVPASASLAGQATDSPLARPLLLVDPTADEEVVSTGVGSVLSLGSDRWLGFTLAAGTVVGGATSAAVRQVEPRGFGLLSLLNDAVCAGVAARRAALLKQLSIV